MTGEFPWNRLTDARSRGDKRRRVPVEFDDDLWDVFLSDDPLETLPEPNDFWIEDLPPGASLADCRSRRNDH